MVIDFRSGYQYVYTKMKHARIHQSISNVSYVNWVFICRKAEVDSQFENYDTGRMPTVSSYTTPVMFLVPTNHDLVELDNTVTFQSPRQ